MKRTQGKVVHSRGTVWNNKLGYSNVQMGWRIENDDGEVIQLGCKSFRQTLISRILVLYYRFSTRKCSNFFAQIFI